VTHHRGYRKANPLAGLTRIEMLLALYDRAILHTEQFGTAIRSGDQAARALHQYKAQKLVAGLAAGLASDESGLNGNLARLFEFCQHQLASSNFAPVLKTLHTLRNAYAEIRAEGNQLEGSGTIPPIDLTGSAFEVMA
jgi:flagellin-specific chaperone FliS